MLKVLRNLYVCSQMKLTNKIPYIILGFFVYLVFYSSCANMGMPDGGPKDSLPPVLVETYPKYKSLNFDDDELRFTFNEYVVHDKAMDVLVISPPLEKRPTLRMKSKSLILMFNEDLKDSTTYSIDFKNSIEDNNERNPYENFRFSFSTGDVLDTLRMAGKVLNAFNLEPLEKALVLLQRNLHDSAVYRVRPPYIARTDEKGIFMMDNIAPGSYHVFSVIDANSNMLYDEGAEEIAFIDSIYVPKAAFVESPDTLVSGADSLLISGHIIFTPEPVYLRYFLEDIFEQYVVSTKRVSQYECSIIFAESVVDTFTVAPVGVAANDWFLLEPSKGMDTISLWIKDTTIAKLDTLELELAYNQLDSAGNVYVQKDTIDFSYKQTKQKEEKKKRRGKDDEEEKVIVPQFTFTDNIKSTGFDLNIPIAIKSPEPLKYFYDDMVHLYLDEDTTATPLSFKLEKDTAKYRSYRIKYNWEENTKYRLEIDSAAAQNIYGITSKNSIRKFTTQKLDYYGKIILGVTNVNEQLIVQLVKNNESEEVLKQKTIAEDGVVEFDFLKPEKYVIKVIYDTNKNGKWDVGSYQDHIQPEMVQYMQKVIKVKSYFEHKEMFDASIDHSCPKVLYDQELEEKKRKEAEQKKLEEQKKKNQPQRSSGGLNSLGRGGF